LFFPLHDQNNIEVKTITVISYAIIGLCLVLHLYQIILGLSDPTGKEQLHFTYKHGLVPAAFFNSKSEYDIGTLKNFFSVKEIERIKNTPRTPQEHQIANIAVVKNSILWVYLMPLTYMFLHGGWMHILSNIWFFWIFTDNVEEFMGPFKFAIFYLLTGVFAGLGHAVLRYDSALPLVGASGAVSAVMGAYVALFPANKVTTYFCPIWFFIRRIDVPAYVVLGMYLLTNLLSMTSSPHSNVAFDAHIFGFIAGFATGWISRKKTV
jgi:membrane associated rhomboid family serine protease